MSRLAITGGTGFVGSNLIELALAGGHEVQALTRRAQPDRDGICWIEGALDDVASLDRLVAGADAVIHVAGVVKGSDEAFRRGNILGTEAIITAATRAGSPRFVHVSSLAAREPDLSAYGRSKRASEAPVTAYAGDWTIVRPPAIYGPGEQDILQLFRAARSGIVPLPPRGRLSVIAVADLCALLLGCLDQPISFDRTYEPDDGVAGGWSHVAFARALGYAVGRRVLPLPVPQAVMRIAARVEERLRGPKARLTSDRVAYMCHPDWTALPQRHPPAALWRAATETPHGLAETARWYRAHGWL